MSFFTKQPDKDKAEKSKERPVIRPGTRRDGGAPAAAVAVAAHDEISSPPRSQSPGSTKSLDPRDIRQMTSKIVGTGGDDSEVQYIKQNESRIVATIKTTEAEKRKTLEEIAIRKEATIAKAAEFFNRLMHKAARLRRQVRTLESQIATVNKEMKRGEEQLARFHTVVGEIDTQRKDIVSRLRQPGWAVPHHYHLTALDHFEGKTQPALMDIGSMIRGHLRLCAAARRAIMWQKQTSELLNNQKSSKEKDQAKLLLLDAHLKQKSPESKELDRIVELVKKRYGDEIARYKKRMEADAKAKAAAAAKAAAQAAAQGGQSAPGDPASTSGTGSKDMTPQRNANYQNVKMRYFQMLNVRSPRGVGDVDEKEARAMLEEQQAKEKEKDKEKDKDGKEKDKEKDGKDKVSPPAPQRVLADGSLAPSDPLEALAHSKTDKTDGKEGKAAADKEKADGKEKEKEKHKGHTPHSPSRDSVSSVDSQASSTSAMSSLSVPQSHSHTGSQTHSPPVTPGVSRTASPNVSPANSPRSASQAASLTAPLAQSAPASQTTTTSTITIGSSSTAHTIAAQAAASKSPKSSVKSLSDKDKDKEKDKGEKDKEREKEREKDLRSSTDRGRTMSEHSYEGDEDERDLVLVTGPTDGGGLCASEWDELKKVVEEMEGIARSQQQAWEELENILDHREHIMQNMGELKKEWEQQEKAFLAALQSPRTPAKGVSTAEALSPTSPLSPTPEKKGKDKDKDKKDKDKEKDKDKDGKDTHGTGDRGHRDRNDRKSVSGSPPSGTSPPLLAGSPLSASPLSTVTSQLAVAVGLEDYAVRTNLLPALPRPTSPSLSLAGMHSHAHGLGHAHGVAELPSSEGPAVTPLLLAHARSTRTLPPQLRASKSGERGDSAASESMPSAGVGGLERSLSGGSLGAMQLVPSRHSIVSTAAAPRSMSLLSAALEGQREGQRGHTAITISSEARESRERALSNAKSPSPTTESRDREKEGLNLQSPSPSSQQSPISLGLSPTSRGAAGLAAASGIAEQDSATLGVSPTTGQTSPLSSVNFSNSSPLGTAAATSTTTSSSASAAAAGAGAGSASYAGTLGFSGARARQVKEKDGSTPSPVNSPSLGPASPTSPTAGSVGSGSVGSGSPQSPTAASAAGSVSPSPSALSPPVASSALSPPDAFSLGASPSDAGERKKGSSSSKRTDG